MKLLPFAGFASLLTCVSIASAQQPQSVRIESSPITTLQTPVPSGSPFIPPSLSAPPVTPELWVYSQEQRRHDDPAQAVRRKAEIQATQRLARLAAMKWYGFSNSRPVASPTPLMGQYSPSWVGNGYDRYDWVGVSRATATIYADGFIIAR